MAALEDELSRLMDPESLEAFLSSERYKPLVEKYGKKQAAIILAKAFTVKLQDRLRWANNGWAADAINDAKKSFVALIARRYVRMLEGVVE